MITITHVDPAKALELHKFLQKAKADYCVHEYEYGSLSFEISAKANIANLGLFDEKEHLCIQAVLPIDDGLFELRKDEFVEVIIT